jgi:hypothetical protein
VYSQILGATEYYNTRQHAQCPVTAEPPKVALSQNLSTLGIPGKYSSILLSVVDTLFVCAVFLYSL